MINSRSTFKDFWWKQWMKRRKTTYSKDHPFHSHFIWYCIEKNVQKVNKESFLQILDMYNNNETLPNGLNERQFTRLQLCCWKNDSNLKHMLFDLGVLHRNKQIDSNFGEGYGWPSRM